MAKGIWKEASKDDPIYKEGFSISSENLRQESETPIKTSADNTDGASTETEKSTPPSESQLEESLQSEESVSTSMTQEEAFGRAMTIKLKRNRAHREAREGKTAKAQQTTPQK